MSRRDPTDPTGLAIGLAKVTARLDGLSYRIQDLVKANERVIANTDAMLSQVQNNGTAIAVIKTEQARDRRRVSSLWKAVEASGAPHLRVIWGTVRVIAYAAASAAAAGFAVWKTLN